jgi:DNA modification methylase
LIIIGEIVTFERGSTDLARTKAIEWLKVNLPQYIDNIAFGLPEYDDRLDAWRVPLKLNNNCDLLLGEIKLSRDLTSILDTTKKTIIINRIKKNKTLENENSKPREKGVFTPSPIPNKVVWGDSTKVLKDFPIDTAQLVFTSPPYFNAKPEYSEYVDYQEYLDFLRKVFIRCHQVLSEGRFCIINISPILVKRASRNSSSKRIAIPFDLHGIMDSIGFEFIDDIIWVKPEGAGWNLGRGRRFKADRQPLQYKPVPVTEYILVYRKKTERLIDWNIRNHYDTSLVENSKILGNYDVTNIWHIHPSTNKKHPASFPDELVRRVIRYYSFIDDLVLDPFAGSGTVGKVALEMNRRFLLIEKEYEYFNLMKSTLSKLSPDNVRIDYDAHEEELEE